MYCETTLAFESHDCFARYRNNIRIALEEGVKAIWLDPQHPGEGIRPTSQVGINFNVYRWWWVGTMDWCALIVFREPYLSWLG
jgi:hypothetical protein